MALDARRLGDRKAGRISAVDAGGDEDVIGQYVGVRSRIAQVERASFPAAVDDGAQAVPQNLHRCSLLLVRDQSHFGDQRIYTPHLPAPPPLLHAPLSLPNAPPAT